MWLRDSFFFHHYPQLHSPLLLPLELVEQEWMGPPLEMDAGSDCGRAVGRLDKKEPPIIPT
jgi:hypothetical protein